MSALISLMDLNIDITYESEQVANKIYKYGKFQGHNLSLIGETKSSI